MTQFSKQRTGHQTPSDLAEHSSAAPARPEMKDLHSSLLEDSQDLLCVHDLQGKLMSVSPAPARILGYEVEELLRMSLPELLAPEFRNQFDDYLARIQRDGVANGWMTLLTRSGERRVWNYHNRLSREGYPSSVVLGLAQDITERVRAERALRASEEKFRSVFRDAGVGMVLVSPEGRFLEANESFCEFLGYSPAELLGKTVQEVTHPDEVEHASWVIDQTLAGARIRRFEKRYLHKTGEIRWGEVSVSLVRNSERRPVYNVAQVLDITQRKRAEEQQKLNLQQTTLLWRIGRLVSSRISVDHVVHAAVDGLIDLLSCDAVLLFQKQGEDLQLLDIRAVESRFKPDAPITHCLGQCLCGLAARDGEPIYCLDIFNDPRCTWEECKKARLHSFAALPLKDADRLIGVLGLASATPRDYEKESSFLEALAAEISVGLGNSLMHQQLADHAARLEHEIAERKRAEEALRRSEERFRVALKDSPIIVCHQDRDLRYTWVHNPRLTWAEQEIVGKTDAEIVGGETALRLTGIKKGVLESGVGTRVEIPVSHGAKQHYLDLTIEPLVDSTGLVTGLTCAATDVTHLHEINEELRKAKEKLTEEKLYLEQQIDTEQGFGEVIGRSEALKIVMENVAKVASIDSTVLILGETGTGKELIARAVHRMSNRNNRAFIKMNCAAIPSGLLESELFGHEKGAFTGAVGRKIGRLELADKGTLFLDDIGEIPLALQPKLLRVLQEQEFERLGSNQTLKGNFRLIAATNQDLIQNVQEKRFRSDLYYRLNVFPIRMPALRERRSDIPLLVEHFVRKHARSMRKSITSIPAKTMDALMQWDWPGNVRELENFLERSVILTHGSVLAAPIGELVAENAVPQGTLELVEREHILRVLKESGGQLSGPGGAAARLGLPRTTLQSKLKQLGIDHRQYRDE